MKLNKLLCKIADHENHARWIYLTTVLCMGENQNSEVCDKALRVFEFFSPQVCESHPSHLRRGIRRRWSGEKFIETWKIIQKICHGYGQRLGQREG